MSEMGSHQDKLAVLKMAKKKGRGFESFGDLHQVQLMKYNIECLHHPSVKALCGLRLDENLGEVRVSDSNL